MTNVADQVYGPGRIGDEARQHPIGGRIEPRRNDLFDGAPFGRVHAV
jgi:hypothetical protein